MIDTDKYERLTIDDWYKMDHHDWKDVVNEYNDLLAEVERLREQFKLAYDWVDTQFPDGGMADFAKYIGDYLEVKE